MLKYTPPRANRAHIIVPAALFIAAALLEAVCLAGASYKVVWQVAAIAMLTAGIELTARFALRSYSYALTDYDESPANALVIVSGQGKRVSRVYIMLDGAVALIPPGDAGVRKGCRRYNFCNTLFSSAQWRLYFNDPGTGEVSEALLELDESFAAELTLRIPV